MKRRALLSLLLTLASGLALGAATVPDTPAGRALAAWLDQINDADHQAAFLANYQTWFTPQSIADWRAGVGGYDLLEIWSTGPTNIFFRVRQRRWPVEEFGRLEVAAKAPTTLESLGAWRIPTGAKVEPLELDATAIARLMERTAGLLEELHADAAIGKRLAMGLRKRAARGEYRGIVFGDALARQVTADLREMADDEHLELRFSYALKTPDSDASQAAEESRRALAANCGFQKAEHLQPNIGYLKVDFFPDAETCAPTSAAAMNFLADSDALILDLRDNNGGRASGADVLMSYLFASRVHLTDHFRRADHATTEGWTLANVPGRRFVGKPVYVLISKRTFSAGEGVAFALQDQKRATLVGETTVGGSGTIEFQPLDDHFTVVVPTGRVTGAVSKQGFAGSGVQPDVKVPAAGALETALKLASAPGH
jgi:hypothetical protein